MYSPFQRWRIFLFITVNILMEGTNRFTFLTLVCFLILTGECVHGGNKCIHVFIVIRAYHDELYRPFTKKQISDMNDAAACATAATVDFCSAFRSHFCDYYLVDRERDIVASLKKYCAFLKSIIFDTLSHELVWCEWLLSYIECISWGTKLTHMEMLMCHTLLKQQKKTPIQMHRIGWISKMFATPRAARSVPIDTGK